MLTQTLPFILQLINPVDRDVSYEENKYMEMIYPRHSARIYVPRQMDGTRGEIILEAAHRNPSSTIHWHLNASYIGSTRHIHQLGIAPEKGLYALTLVDENGYTLVHRFEIIDL